MMTDPGPLISRKAEPCPAVCFGLIKRFVLCLVVCFVLMVLIAGCRSLPFSFRGLAGGPGSSLESGQDKKASLDFFAMDTYMTLTAYGDGAEEALEEAKEEVIRIENLVSTGKETSEISRFNTEGRAVLSGESASMIRESLSLSEDTKGSFDITVYPLMKAWGFAGGGHRIPEAEEIKRLLSCIGPDGLKLDGNSLLAVREGVEIDLGGIAKGYTSDRIINLFKKAGISHAVISLGGNVAVLNDRPDGSAWQIAIEDPAFGRDQEGASSSGSADASKSSGESGGAQKKKDSQQIRGIAGFVRVKNKCVITSGNYERYFEANGKRYHHIIDPASGYPAESGLDSVTIVCEDGSRADGLSTALFVMGQDKAQEYWRKHKEDFDMILIGSDGDIQVTEGIADSFVSEREWETIRR